VSQGGQYQQGGERAPKPTENAILYCMYSLGLPWSIEIIHILVRFTEAGIK